MTDAYLKVGVEADAEIEVGDALERARYARFAQATRVVSLPFSVAVPATSGDIGFWVGDTPAAGRAWEITRWTAVVPSSAGTAVDLLAYLYAGDQSYNPSLNALPASGTVLDVNGGSVPFCNKHGNRQVTCVHGQILQVAIVSGGTALNVSGSIQLTDMPLQQFHAAASRSLSQDMEPLNRLLAKIARAEDESHK